MKVCRECNKEKPFSDFYKHPKMADGHLNKCSECVKTRVTKHREANLEKVRGYDKQRYMLPHRIQARKEYEQTEQGKATRKRRTDSYNKRYPLTHAAHIITSNAIKNKKLKRAESCSVCGIQNLTEGHHDDYTKPLEVRWLCNKCHREWHKENTPIYE